MTYMPKPKFMENDEWYYFDFETGTVKLTEKAPKEAKESYDKFMKQLGGTIEAPEDEED